MIEDKLGQLVDKLIGRLPKRSKGYGRSLFYKNPLNILVFTDEM